MNIKITEKIRQLVDLLCHTENGQGTPEALTKKQRDFKFITGLQQDYNSGIELTETDMLTCNVIWKRYK